MPDYIPEASVEAYVTSAIQKTLDGIAGARVPNQLVLNPDELELDFIILFEQGAVETESTQSPAEQTESVSDTPGVSIDVASQVDPGRTDSETQTPPGRTTSTVRSGGDATTTTRNYEEFED